METLSDIYGRHAGDDFSRGSDKGNVHSYIEAYTELLEPYRATALRVLEIGLMAGHSLRMWEEYFSGAWVAGLDYCDKPLGMVDLRPMIDEGTHHIFLADAMNAEQVAAHFYGMHFDVIIEDASHSIEQQKVIYANFKKYLYPGAIYIIEDIADIDKTRKDFENIDPAKSVTILDRRKIKDRFDDVLVVIRDPVRPYLKTC